MSFAQFSRQYAAKRIVCWYLRNCDVKLLSVDSKRGGRSNGFTFSRYIDEPFLSLIDLDSDVDFAFSKVNKKYPGWYV